MNFIDLMDDLETEVFTIFCKRLLPILQETTKLESKIVYNFVNHVEPLTALLILQRWENEEKY
tara:strand:+ start:3467 stop:3655 length:189 start_codon:yes stop_codon:yes gene_type:complete